MKGIGGPAESCSAGWPGAGTANVSHSPHLFKNSRGLILFSFQDGLFLLFVEVFCCFGLGWFWVLSALKM